MEHLTNPTDMFLIANRLLRPGGILYFTTPNFGSLSRWLTTDSKHLYYPEHLSSMTKKTVNVLADLHGFEVLSIRTYGIASKLLISRP